MKIQVKTKCQNVELGALMGLNASTLNGPECGSDLRKLIFSFKVTSSVVCDLWFFILTMQSVTQGGHRQAVGDASLSSQLSTIT